MKQIILWCLAAGIFAGCTAQKPGPVADEPSNTPPVGLSISGHATVGVSKTF